MAVKLTIKFSKADIKRLLDERKQRIEQALLFRLQRIGEEFVTNARDKATFTDRTGNLRSSIGYVIMKDGKQLFSNFRQVSKGKSGVSQAKEVAKASAANFSSGFVLVVCAGMEYAAAVESRGFDVLTASSVIAENALKRSIKEIDKKSGTL